MDWLRFQAVGRDEVYVRSSTGEGSIWPISNGGGVEPVWSADGRELFYRADDKMMAVDVVLSPAISFGKAHVLFEGSYHVRPNRIPGLRRFARRSSLLDAQTDASLRGHTVERNHELVRRSATTCASFTIMGFSARTYSRMRSRVVDDALSASGGVGPPAGLINTIDVEALSAKPRSWFRIGRRLQFRLAANGDRRRPRRATIRQSSSVLM